MNTIMKLNQDELRTREGLRCAIRDLATRIVGDPYEADKVTRKTLRAWRRDGKLRPVNSAQDVERLLKVVTSLCGGAEFDMYSGKSKRKAQPSTRSVRKMLSQSRDGLSGSAGVDPCPATIQPSDGALGGPVEGVDSGSLHEDCPP
jgi:hypothetical protein